MAINIGNVPLSFEEGDSTGERVQKLNDLVNQLTNAIVTMNSEIEALQAKIKQLEE